MEKINFSVFLMPYWKFLTEFAIVKWAFFVKTQYSAYSKWKAVISQCNDTIICCLTGKRRERKYLDIPFLSNFYYCYLFFFQIYLPLWKCLILIPVVYIYIPLQFSTSLSVLQLCPSSLLFFFLFVCQYPINKVVFFLHNIFCFLYLLCACVCGGGVYLFDIIHIIFYLFIYLFLYWYIYLYSILYFSNFSSFHNH